MFKKRWVRVLKEKVTRWLVWRLPRRLVYWAAIRLIAYATTGKFSNVEVPKLTAMDAVQAWE